MNEHSIHLTRETKLEGYPDAALAGYSRAVFTLASRGSRKPHKGAGSRLDGVHDL